MRVADKMNFTQVTNHIGKNRTKMADMQNQAATMKRVTKPGDDPVAAARVLGTRVDLVGNRQFVKSLNYAKGFLEYTDQTLSELTDYLVRAKELALGQASDASANEQSRLIVATEINQIFNQAVLTGNRKLGERFIFGGYKTTTPPFDTEGHYFGDAGEIMIHTDKESYISMNVPGSKVFLGLGLGNDGVAQPVKVQPKTTEQLLADRREAGLPVETLGAGGMKVTGNPIAEGERTKSRLQTGREHGDTRRPTPREDAASRLESQAPMRGPASIPGALRSGGVNASAEASTPSGDLTPKPPQEQGGVNIFQVLRKLEIALRTNDKEGIQDTLTDLDAAISQVVLSRSTVGARNSSLDSLFQSLEKSKVDNNILISNLEDADVFETVSNINQTEQTLQATLQTSGKLIQGSLLDFLG